MSPRDELALPGPAAPDPEPSAGPDPAAVWADAALVAALLAIDPGLGGALVRARPGQARDAWCALHAGLLPPRTPIRRLPAAISEDRLLGGLDLAATLSARRPVWSPGVLAEADGGVVVMPMAERAAPGLVAQIGAALDRGEVRAERDGRASVSPARLAVVALDEGAEPDERAPAALADRLAFRLELDGLPRAVIPQDPLADAPATPEEIVEARAALNDLPAPPELIEAIVRAAEALGIDGLRAPLLALRCARAAAALLGADAPGEIEAALAARLVLGPRATRLPAPPPEDVAEDDDQTPPPEPPPEQDPEDADPPEDETPPAETRDAALEDKVLEAAAAALPPDLLARLAAEATRRPAAQSGAGAERKTPERGRPAGSRAAPPRRGARLDLIGTLRAAAPWQPVRRAAEAQSGRAPSSARIRVRPEDFRIKRFKRRGESALLFVVDASGSAALARLAEVKGAVELMLSEAYVRREQAALIAFRGARAEVLLPPTRSLVQAKRRLAALPGGGGTPLAAGLEAGLTLADQLRSRGVAPFLVILTDGRANVDREGRGGRARAMHDAHAAARALRAAGHACLLIDASARPHPAAADLAAELGTRALALPRADAAGLAAAARAGADAAAGTAG